MATKTCTRCNKEKSVTGFAQAGNDPRYRRKVCNACRGRADRARNRDKRNAHHRDVRNASPIQSLIWVDSRKEDRKKGRDNDLTKDFIAAEIAKGCSYCGESEIRMTLDRIDNNKGHTMDNVVPACIRCNYTRKDMPYEAWLLVSKGMREAQEEGLFNEWTGRVK